MFNKTLATPVSIETETDRAMQTVRTALSPIKAVIVYLHPSDGSEAFARLVQASHLTPITRTHGGSFQGAYELSQTQQIPAVQLVGFGFPGDVPDFSAQTSGPILSGEFGITCMFVEPFQLKMASLSEAGSSKIILGPKPILDQVNTAVQGERIAVNVSAGECAKWMACQDIPAEKAQILNEILTTKNLTKADCAVAAMPAAFKGLNLHISTEDVQKKPLKYYMIATPNTENRVVESPLSRFDFTRPVSLGNNIAVVLPKVM